MSERKEVLPEQTVDGSSYVRALIDNQTFGKMGRQQDAMLSDYELGKAAGRVEAIMEALAKMEALLARIAELERPIDMVLHCPKCGVQHIDEPDPHPPEGVDVTPVWTNPPHRRHLCHSCGYRWRPADVATNGVAAVKTRGKDDDPIVTPKPRVPDWDAIKDKRIRDTGRSQLVFLLRRLDEVTPWFDGDVQPARPGVYERNYRSPLGGPWFAEWTGTQWLSPASTPQKASTQVTAAFTQWGIPWRGLAQEPKA